MKSYIDFIKRYHLIIEYFECDLESTSFLEMFFNYIGIAHLQFFISTLQSLRLEINEAMFYKHA